MKDSVSKLDIEKLGRYLEGQIPGFKGLREASKFPGGQSNPTFKLVADSGFYVLRRKPPGNLLPSAHAVDREFRVISALANTKVPVAPALHLCDNDEVIGSMFYVMGFMEGRVFWNPALPDCSNTERSAIYDEMNRVLAALHSVNVEAAGLADYGRPGDYFARQISRWGKQYRASETETIEAMDFLLDWLPANLPADDGQQSVSLIHGDYRLDNIMFHPARPRAIAVLDWELSTLGHPYADLAYQCMHWRISNHGVIGGLGGIDRKSLGIPTEEEYLQSYCQRRGLGKIANWNFYLAFSFFRLAAILQGVKKRALEGNASSQKAMDYGAMAAPLAVQGAALIADN